MAIRFVSYLPTKNCTIILSYMNNKNTSILAELELHVLREHKEMSTIQKIIDVSIF